MQSTLDNAARLIKGVCQGGTFFGANVNIIKRFKPVTIAFL